MPQDELSRALGALDTPYLIDGDATPSIAGTDFPATTADGRRVMVTRLRPSLAARLSDVDAFLRVLAERQHLAGRRRGEIMGAGLTAGGAMFVVRDADQSMETLDVRLRRGTVVPSPELQSLAERLALFLGQAHGASMVHGVIMPATIMLRHDSCSVMWPGLFTALRAGGMTAAEIGDELQCTRYLAPELLSGGQESIQSDVFGLGASLYEALTGRPPFGGRTTATVMASVLADGLAPTPNPRTDSLAGTILRAIERDPADRWHDMQQLHDSLLAPEPIAPPRATLSSFARRRPVLPLLILAGGALALWRMMR